MTTLSQRTFSSGEISPSLYARVDLVKYATGLRTCKNNLVLRYGGLSNRPGTVFISEVSDSSKVVRLIPFIFNINQTYVLEFGNLYMRVIKDGVAQTEAAVNISGVTRANPAVVTTASPHGYVNGDEVYISGVGGMTQLNNRNFKVANVASTTYELKEMDGTNINSSAYTTYTSSGSGSKIFEISTSYLEAELATINFVQSADVITLVHPNHPPRDLARTGDIAWTLTDVNFIPEIGRPTALSVASGGGGSNIYRYQVTAIDSETFEESLVGYVTASNAITGLTNADPAVVTASSHFLADGDPVFLKSIVGTTEVNDSTFIVSGQTSHTFSLEGVDSTNYGVYASGGTAHKAYGEISSAAVPSASAPHTISWAAVANATEYNIYKETNGVFGQIGVAKGTSFKDINITPNTTFTPPSTRNPFLGTGNFPSAVTYIQQRRVFANTDSDPEKIFMSRTSNFKNFTTSSPSQSDDAITFTMAGRQVNEVKSMLDLGRMVILTSGGEWSVEGEAGVITPTTINTKQYSYNGSGDLAPIVIDGAAIYQQARGSILRDLSYNFEQAGYVGNDLTIFSAHLFDRYTMVDWAFQQIPHSILWVVRSDGVLLGLTFVRNQQVMAWHRHDTQGGTYENVTVVPEGNEDVLYVTVKRTINSKVVRYIEKLSTRQINDIEDSKFMDANLSFDGTNTSATTMTVSGGTTWVSTESLTLTASAPFFTAAEVGNAIHLKGASKELIRATITAYTSTTIVTVKPHKTVPTDLRGVATAVWTRAVDQLSGLWHLEGEDVAIFADGFVVASPNNASYDTITVANGIVTLDKPYGVIHVGLPYISDIETLDVDTVSGETLSDKKKIVGEVSMFVEDTRGVWVGPKPPTDDSVDPLENLREVKIRSTENYDSPVSLATDNIEINIKPEWNSNGRVFVRQVDPIPMTVLSINPAGKFPFSGGK